jgi:dihydroneopterin aldolase
MTTDIELAFAHPSERAIATATQLRDRISLRDHIVEVEIGAFQAERGMTQRISFNIAVEIQPLSGEIADDVDRILSYDRVTEAIAYELAAERLNLLETLADRVAERILLEPQAMRVFVRIEKLDRGPGALGVEIVRDRDGLALVPDEENAAIHPHVVSLSNAAIGSEHLSGWLDQLAADDLPVILCVGMGAGNPPKSALPQAQRRVDLLAIEQNAWVLAGRDRRCVVVGTLTELDWGMRNAQISVWAPSKMVLDAVDGPDGDDLVGWFATHLSALKITHLGDAQADQAVI